MVYRLTFSRERVLVTIEMGQQRTWDHIPKRNCMWDTIKTKKNSSEDFFYILWKCETLAR